MTGYEKLAQYERELDLLMTQKRELEEALEELNQRIHDKQVEIDECEAFYFSDEDE